MTDKKYISKLLTYEQIRIRTNLCHEIRIRRMRIFLSFVTTLAESVERWVQSRLDPCPQRTNKRTNEHTRIPAPPHFTHNYSRLRLPGKVPTQY